MSNEMEVEQQMDYYGGMSTLHRQQNPNFAKRVITTKRSERKDTSQTNTITVNVKDNKMQQILKKKGLNQQQIISMISPQQQNNDRYEITPISWIEDSVIEQTQDLTNWMKEVQRQINENTSYLKAIYNTLNQFLIVELQDQSSSNSIKYHACLDHQFFNDNGIDMEYVNKFVQYLLINGNNEVQVQQYLALYALSQTIVQQILTINGTTATQAIYQNEYIIYTDPNLEAGQCSVVCDKCGAKIVNRVDVLVQYLEMVYCGQIISDEKLSNFHHINCGNQFFSKVGVGIKKSQSNIGPYEFIGMGDPTELAKLQWEVLPDFSILGIAFKEGNYLSGTSRRRGGERTNLQNENDKIQQLATIALDNNNQMQVNQVIATAFNNIPQNTIMLNNERNLPVFDNDMIQNLVNIRQQLNNLFENNAMNVETNLKIVFRFDAMLEQFKFAFRGLNGRKSYQNIQELVVYLLKFKQFVDKLNDRYNKNPHEMYISNVDEQIQTIDNLIIWITNVWKRIQVFVQVLFWFGQQNDQADQQIQQIRQNILDAQQQQQNLGKKILRWWYDKMLYNYRYNYNNQNITEQEFRQQFQQQHLIGDNWFNDINQQINRLLDNINDDGGIVDVLAEIQFMVAQNAVEQINLDNVQNYIQLLQNFVRQNPQNGLVQDINQLIRLLDQFIFNVPIPQTFIIYDCIVQNNEQNLPQNRFNILLQNYITLNNLANNNPMKKDLQNFCILLYAYLLCQDDRENTNIFNQMICKLNYVKAQIKQVHVFRVAHLMDLGKQIHCLYGQRIEWYGDNEIQQNNQNMIHNYQPWDDDGQALGRWGCFDDQGQYIECQMNQQQPNVWNEELIPYNNMTKNYNVFKHNVELFQSVLREFIDPNLNINSICLFQIQHQLPLNTQGVKNDQSIKETNNMFGQMYDDMNIANLHIVYSPIFGQVPLRHDFANALGAVVQNGDGLNNTDIVYFQKQTIKHIMTHNMLKYHYKDIDEQTQNNFIQHYINNQTGQKMNAIIRGVIGNLRIGYYWSNVNTYMIYTVVQSNGHNYMVFIERHNNNNNTYKIKLYGEDQTTINQNMPQGYTPWEQIYLVINGTDVFDKNRYNGWCDKLNTIRYHLQKNQLQELNAFLNNDDRRKKQIQAALDTYQQQNELYTYAQNGKIDHNTSLNLLRSLKGIIQQQLVNNQRKPGGINTIAVYLNHGLFQINPQRKNILENYTYFLELQQGGFDQNNNMQQNFFKLQLYGKFLYDLLDRLHRDQVLYSFTQTGSVYSTLVNMWLHVDDNLVLQNNQNELPDAVNNIINSIPNPDAQNIAGNRTPRVLNSLNSIYNRVFPQDQQQQQQQRPQGFMKFIIKQIIAITVLRSFVGANNNGNADGANANNNGNAHVFQQNDNNGNNFRTGYMDIINTKFQQIQQLIESLTPNQIDQNNQQQIIPPIYNDILQNIRTYIIGVNNVVIDFDANNFNVFIDALKNLAGQCDDQYPVMTTEHL